MGVVILLALAGGLAIIAGLTLNSAKRDGYLGPAGPVPMRGHRRKVVWLTDLIIVAFTAFGVLWPLVVTPVTVRAGVEALPPPRDLVPWSYKWDPILGSSTSGGLWTLGLAVAAVVIGTLWWRATVESSPGFPLQYTPPEGLGPVQMEYIRTESVPAKSLTATLLYLAERRVISLTQTDRAGWSIRGIADEAQWDLLDPVSRRGVAALRVNTPGSEFRADGTAMAGKQLNRATINIAEAVQDWAFDNDLMVKTRSEWWIRGANLVALVLALEGFALWLFPATMWGIPFAMFFGVTARGWLSGVGARRTLAGRELWSRAGGFHRMLTTDSAEPRFDFAVRKDLYTAYIPFAVAAGVAPPWWAKKYEAAMGEPAPQPDWYDTTMLGADGFSGGTGGPDFDSFESALSSSIGAYTISASGSGGSGFGGGGS